jgi:DNA-binding protein YbaB
MSLCPRRADTVPVTTVRKLLLAVLLVSLAGSAFGAGTFATFNASTTNAGSTFATGTLVLSNKVNSQVTACFSTGAGSTTDTNSNAACNSLFATTVSKPSDTATVDLDLQGVGTLSASKLVLFAASACASTQNLVATPYTGTGDLCEQTQLTVQETASNHTTAQRCWYGGVGAGTITSNVANITFPITISTANNNDLLKIQFNGQTALDNVAINAGSVVYDNPFTLAAAIQTAIRAAAGAATAGKQALVGGTWVTTASAPGQVGSGTVSIATATPGTSGSVTISTPTTAARSALPALGFTSGAGGSTSTGSNSNVACTPDSAHSIEGLTTAFTNAANTPSLDFGAPPSGAPATRFFRITLTLPSTAGNDVQGRLATFGLTWRIDQ